MAPTVYIETSIVSYLTATPSRDLIMAAHQQATHDWWENHRPSFDLVISQLVLQEAGQGAADTAKRRLEALQEIKLVPIPEEAVDLAQRVTRAGILAPEDLEDALHISIATVYGIDCLLTWNFKHMANLTIEKRNCCAHSKPGLRNARNLHAPRADRRVEMYEDPIVEELRAIRREHVRRFNCDPRAIFEDLKKQEAESDRAFVQRDIKRVSKSGDVEAA